MVLSAGVCWQAEAGLRYNLDISMFERLLRLGGFPVQALETQRRMHPAISRLIRATIYPALKVMHTYSPVPRSFL